MAMTRGTRLALIVVGGLVTVLVLAAAALPFLVDVNRYAPVIAAQIKQATGREVALGRMSLRLLPSPNLSVGPLRVADSALHPGRDALKAETLSIRVGLLPLLRGRIDIKSILLKRPTLTVIRDGRGRWNFDDLLAAAAAPATPAAARPPSSQAIPLTVAHARITDAKILVYDDAVTPGARSQITLAPVDATIEGWGTGGGTSLDLRIGLGKSLLKADARLTSVAGGQTLTAATDAPGLRAEDLLLILPWTGVARPPGLRVGGSVDLSGRLEMPLARPELQRFVGSLRLNGLSYRDATMTRPVDRISGTLRVDGDKASWDGFGVRVGSSSVSGNLQVEGFARPRVGFALKSPRLDLNEILTTFAPSNAPAKSSTPSSGAGFGVLELVTGQGKLEVEAIRFLNFELSGLKASAALEKGAFSLRDLGAGFYEGRLHGSARVDLGRAVPASAMGVALEQVDVAPLLSAYDPALKGLLRGRLTGSMDVTASGADMDRILDSATGGAQLTLTQGSLTSFSVLKQLGALLEMAGGKGIGREETPFEYLKGDLTIASGKARTENLALHATDLDLEGRGWVGLDATMDLDIVARFSEESTDGMVAKNARLAHFTEKNRLTVYCSLQGPLAGPGFKLNTRQQAGTVKEKVKDSLRRRLEDRLLKPQETKPPGDSTSGEDGN